MIWDINKAFAELQETVNSNLDKKDSRIKYLENRIKHLESEHFKDDEIKRLQEENKRLQEDNWRGFPITESEEKAVINWWKKHREEKHNGKIYTGTIGGDLVYEFYPSSIGTFGTVKCTCGEEFTFMEP